MFTVQTQTGAVVGIATTLGSAHSIAEAHNYNRLTIRNNGRIIEIVIKGGTTK
jgi:hypothetical protein